MIFYKKAIFISQVIKVSWQPCNYLRDLNVSDDYFSFLISGLWFLGHICYIIIPSEVCDIIDRFTTFDLILAGDVYIYVPLMFPRKDRVKHVLLLINVI